MRSKWKARVPLVVTAVSLFNLTRGYVLAPGCGPYASDIQKAVAEFVDSANIGRILLDPQAEYPSLPDEMEFIDWTGLLDPLFPLMTPAQEMLLPTILRYVETFDKKKYRNVWAIPTLPPIGSGILASLDSSALFSCDPTAFTRIHPNEPDSLWTTPDSPDELYDVTTDNEICPPGMNLRLAANTGRLPHFIVVLCPEILTQKEGRFKMFATLDGQELSHTRPDSGSTLDMLAWEGMHVDQLRERVLSVQIGRVILMIIGQKYHDEITIRPIPGYQTFEKCLYLTRLTYLENLDSLSIYITGAKFHLNQILPSEGRRPLTSLTVHRWNETGILKHGEHLVSAGLFAGLDSGSSGTGG